MLIAPRAGAADVDDDGDFGPARPAQLGELRASAFRAGPSVTAMTDDDDAGPSLPPGFKRDR